MAEQIQPERSSRSVSIVAEGSAESPGRVPLLGFTFCGARGGRRHRENAYGLFVWTALLALRQHSCVVSAQSKSTANGSASSAEREDAPVRTARGRPSPCATANRPPACCFSAGPLAVGVRGQPCRSLVVSEPLRKMRFARRCSAASATSGSSMLKQFCWRR